MSKSVTRHPLRSNALNPHQTARKRVTDMEGMRAYKVCSRAAMR
jgi:hypothetical protein